MNNELFAKSAAAITLIVLGVGVVWLSANLLYGIGVLLARATKSLWAAKLSGPAGHWLLAGSLFVGGAGSIGYGAGELPSSSTPRTISGRVEPDKLYQLLKDKPDAEMTKAILAYNEHCYDKQIAELNETPASQDGSGRLGGMLIAGGIAMVLLAVVFFARRNDEF